MSDTIELNNDVDLSAIKKNDNIDLEPSRRAPQSAYEQDNIAPCDDQGNYLESDAPPGEGFEAQPVLNPAEEAQRRSIIDYLLGLQNAPLNGKYLASFDLSNIESMPLEQVKELEKKVARTISIRSGGQFAAAKTKMGLAMVENLGINLGLKLQGWADHMMNEQPLFAEVMERLQIKYLNKYFTDDRAMAIMVIGESMVNYDRMQRRIIEQTAVTMAHMQTKSDAQITALADKYSDL